MQPNSAALLVEKRIERRRIYEIRSALIYKFANIGLIGREISWAIDIETKGQLKISPDNVRDLVYRARGRGSIRPLTDEERKDIQKTTSNPWDYTDRVMDKDIRSILEGIKELEEKGKPLPQNRLELKKFRVSQKGSAVKKKEGGVRIGQKIVFPDGTHIPTSEGIRHTPELNNKISINQLGQPEPKEKVRKQSIIYEVIGPLCARDQEMSTAEWSEITQYLKKPISRLQIVNAIKSRKRPEWHRLPREFYLTENVQERYRRGRKLTLAQQELKEGRLSFPEQEIAEERKSQRMVAHFLDKGFFNWNLTVWQKVKDMYEEYKKPFTSAAKMLIIEVLLSAIEQVERGDKSLLDEYVQIGNDIDPKWLISSEGFIKAKLLVGWADGEDEEGFFKLNITGGKIRSTDIVGGVFMNDNSALAIKKLRIKAINNRNGNGNRNGQAYPLAKI